MSEAFIVDGIRSPIGAHGGSLARVRADDLAAHVISALLERHPKLAREAIDDVIFGCANQAGEDNRNIARMAALLAGLPVSVPGETVNRLCASGMSAAVRAAHSAQAGAGDLFIAGGVESMTRAPFVLAKAEGAFARSQELFDTSIGWRFVNPKMAQKYGVDSMGETAEHVARRYEVDRDAQDRFALFSQQKATQARESGRFAREIAPLTVPHGRRETRLFNEDEFIRPDSSLEVLAKLRPAFMADGTVTAGNSSGINDGACALLIASSNALKTHQLRPLSRIKASAVVGVEPKYMGMGPVGASKKALAMAGITLADLDVIELNEAFAAQSIACIRELGLKESDSRINPNGGAIALGHPLGMSGARLLLTAALELELRQARYALCTMCVGVGQGMATVIERVLD